MAPYKEMRLAGLTATAWGRKYYDDLVMAHGRERAETVLVAAART